MKIHRLQHEECGKVSGGLIELISVFYIHTGNFHDSLVNTIIHNKGIWYSAGSHTLARGDTPGKASVCNRITGS